MVGDASCAWPVSDFLPYFLLELFEDRFFWPLWLANYFVNSLFQFGNACFNRSLGVHVFKVCSLTPGAQEPEQVKVT